MKMNKDLKDQLNNINNEFALVRGEMQAGFADVNSKIDAVEDGIRHLHVLFEDQMSKLQAIAENFGTLELHRQRLVDHDERITQLENSRPIVIAS